jgi:hypothetical protein
MPRIILRPGDDGFWISECLSYPEFVTKGRTKLEARAKFRKAVDKFEKYLEKVEADPKFIEMMERSEADIRAGRVHTHEEVEAILRRKRAASKV